MSKTPVRTSCPKARAPCSVVDSHVYADDANVGLVNGELAIPGYLLRREVFDPVVEQVNHAIALEDSCS